MDFEDNNPLSVSADEDAVFAGIEELQRSQLTRAAPSSAPIADGKLAIIDAGKSREGSQRGHITYTIRLPSGVCVRRRYSEFESLRRCLRRLFPTIVVPPIPEKHSISAYATNPAHAHEDSKIIEHRQRMLGAFLNRSMDIPQLRGAWLLERFLDPNTTWNEVLMSDAVLSLPKSPLQAPPLDPVHPTPAHAYLPIPPNGTRLRTPSDNKDDAAQSANSSEFKDAESRAKEFEMVIGGGLEKTARKTTKHYTQLAADCADLGGQFNAFSLDNHSTFTHAIEKVGQAVDTQYLSTEALVDQLSIDFSEPLGESVQMAATARQVLKYRRYRALQVDMTADQLAAKRCALADLEKAESEAQRISSFLHADERISAATASLDLSQTRSSPAPTTASAAPGAQHSHRSGSVPAGSPQPPESDRQSLISIETLEDPLDGASESGDAITSATSAAPSAPSRPRFRLPGLSQLNYAIHGMMDVDPEAARRASITRTQEQIANLEAALKVAREDAASASDAVRDELARYHTSKETDIKHLVKAFVRCHIEWAEKNLEAWMEARQAVGN